MKKILFILLGLLFGINTLEAQLKLDSTLRREIVAKSNQEYMDADRLVIAPVLDSDSVFLTNEAYTCKPYDILIIFDRSYPTGTFSDMLLVNNDEWTILEINQTYSEMIEDVLEYFEINDEIDKRLLPIYIQKVTKEYLYEYMGNSQYGPWRSWSSQKPQDTIAVQYGKYMDLKSFKNNDLEDEEVVKEKADNIFEHIWNYYF